MIWTVFQVNLRRLLNNRIELLLTFVVPIAFFSVFAVIFGGGVGTGKTAKIKVVVLDQVESPLSRSVVESLKQSAGLRLMREQGPQRLTPKDARELVRRGAVTLAIVIRSQSESISVDLLTDASDQVAGQVGSALVSQSLMLAKAEQMRVAARLNPFASADAVTPPSRPSFAADATVTPDGSQPLEGRQAPEGSDAFEDRQSSQLRPADILNRNSAKLSGATPVDETGARAASDEAISVQNSVRLVDVMGEGKANPVVSMYAAGIAVMFLLFGAAGGGGALLEERESQTLDRLLSTRLSMDQLLLGKWFYMTAIGVLQVGVMFVWGQIIFGVDLLGHFDGFVIMTVVTASAASAFGLFLATLCRTRGQLNGLSVILILTMSALGGSMVPRYVMSEKLQAIGLWTFNAWALDGYDKVFWRELPVGSLSPQLAVLLGCGMFFLMLARGLAVRWESD